MSLEIEGRSIVVTGGARGIGLHVVAALLKRGARVTMTARSEASLANAREQLGAHEEIAGVASDLKTAEGCYEVAKHAVATFGGIDALFTNAGVYAETNIEHATEAQWDEVIDANLKSTFFTIQAALPALRQSRGVIVTMSSYNGVDGVSGHASAYGAAKAGVINLTRSLALDLAPDVRVNAIAPGFIETEKLREAPGSDELIAQLDGMTPLGRIGTGEEIAHALAFAIENEFLNGAVINIDGGRCAGR